MVASAEFDPVVVDQGITPEKTAQLIALKRESAKLDYKRDWVGDNQAIVELTKDVVAMANTAGGYVIFGVGDDGEEVGLADEEIERLDEAILRTQVQGYLGTGLDLFVNKRIEVKGKPFAVLTVLRSSRSPLVFEHDGQYSDQRGRMRPVFRAGDVYVRHGSASQKWNQDDVRTINARVVDRERERWIKEVVPDLRRLMQEAAPGPVAQLTPQEILHTDAETFKKTLNNLLFPRST